jgi:hypothetical protein
VGDTGGMKREGQPRRDRPLFSVAIARVSFEGDMTQASLRGERRRPHYSQNHAQAARTPPGELSIGWGQNDINLPGSLAVAAAMRLHSQKGSQKSKER